MTTVAQPNSNISDNINTLADRAMLVRLARKRLRVTIRDKALEDTVRNNSGDDSITVSKHLFRDKHSPVRDLVRKSDEVYRQHKELTLPWLDTGVRLLRSDKYMDYMNEIRSSILDVQKDVPYVVDNWETLVSQDIASRGPGASRDEYPEAYEVEAMFGFDIQVMPLPTSNDFRVDVDQATKNALDRALEEAEANARREIINRMMQPLHKAAEKLAVPIGEQGAVFRDSLVSNIHDSVRLARELNISDDPNLEAQLESIESSVYDAFGTPDAPATTSLRQNQTQREKAASKVDDILNQLGGM